MAEHTEGERIARLEERTEAQCDSTTNIEHFLFGNAREGFVKTVENRLKRIEIIGVVLLLLGVGKAVGFESLTKILGWLGNL